MNTRTAVRYVSQIKHLYSHYRYPPLRFPDLGHFLFHQKYVTKCPSAWSSYDITQFSYIIKFDCIYLQSN
jgi:hypothetical protein